MLASYASLHLWLIDQVLSVGTECDIAMLTVEDPSFWEDLGPVRFGQLPKLQEAVTVIGCACWHLPSTNLAVLL